METFVAKLRQDYSWITFAKASMASWSPSKKQISYELASEESAQWSVLHELGHALLGHQSYESDVGLLQKEAEAWEKALELAESYKLSIDPDHIDHCLDTYRDWLHKRSTCPDCASHGLQQSKALYHCINCQVTWKVSNARF